MLFDSHAHLNDARFDEDREALIQKLQEEHGGFSIKSRC